MTQLEGLDRARGNRHQEHRKPPLNITELFFTVRVPEHWHRLSRQVVGPQSLEIKAA